jgi:hypothetical protein
LLSEGYFSAAGLPSNVPAAARYLKDVGTRLAARTANGCILLMHGFDHAAPQPHTAAVAAALTEQTGWQVERGLLEHFAQRLTAEPPRFTGALVGGRLANLLPGVWSTRTYLKLRNRRAETSLEAWAEPWAAFGTLLGLADERPALRQAWRALLQNQAHDSICGCSIDRVHTQMMARYDTAQELAEETTKRVLERIAGVDPARRTPWGEIEIAVFNPSPHPRTDVVQLALDPFTWIGFPGETEREMALHPWLLPALARGGFMIDGLPARVIVDENPQRPRAFPNVAPVTLELIAKDVPACGYRRFRIESGPPQSEEDDDGHEIRSDELGVIAAADGTFTFTCGDQAFAGLFAIEDSGDRGDTYDYDPVAGDPASLVSVRVRRRRAPNGIQCLRVERALRIAACLDESRERRGDEQVIIHLVTEARLAPGVHRVDVQVRLDNRARDHRLRVLFPTGGTAPAFAATTFDVARCNTAASPAHDWVHPPPTTFPHQGFVSANGLTVVAPGLPEAAISPDGVIAITLVRAVGWLARWDLRTRPQPAGPGIPTPEAQCLGIIDAVVSLFSGLDPRAARDAEIGLRAVIAGANPRLAPERSLLRIRPDEVVLSALKPAESGQGFIIRVLNPTAATLSAELTFGCEAKAAVPVRLDEAPIGDAVAPHNGAFRIDVPPHALRSLWII